MSDLELTQCLAIPALKEFLDSISSKRKDKIEDNSEEIEAMEPVVQIQIKEKANEPPKERLNSRGSRGRRGRRFHKPKSKGQSFLESL